MSELIRRAPGAADDGPLADLRLRDYAPVPAIAPAAHRRGPPGRACVDVHNHLGRWLTEDGGWTCPDVGALLDLMDRRGVASTSSTSTVAGATSWTPTSRATTRAHPGRFVTFCHLDWRHLHADRPTDLLVGGPASRRARPGCARRQGLEGPRACTSRDARRRARPARRRAARATSSRRPASSACRSSSTSPTRSRSSTRSTATTSGSTSCRTCRTGGSATGVHPTFDRLLDALAHAWCAAPPGTTFIGAHVGCVAEDLDWVGALMTARPNFHVDIAGRMAELGRQPRRFRRLVEAHPDRVLFGTDASRCEDDGPGPTYFRFLETDDECFAVRPRRARSRRRAAGRSAARDLPAELLPGVYRDNAPPSHQVLTGASGSKIQGRGLSGGSLRACQRPREGAWT